MPLNIEGRRDGNALEIFAITFSRAINPDSLASRIRGLSLKKKAFFATALLLTIGALSQCNPDIRIGTAGVSAEPAPVANPPSVEIGSYHDTSTFPAWDNVGMGWDGGMTGIREYAQSITQDMPPPITSNYQTGGK